MTSKMKTKYCLRSQVNPSESLSKYNLCDLPRTRSGRIVIPRLDFWRFERIVHLKTGEIFISTNPLNNPEKDLNSSLKIEQTKNVTNLSSSISLDPIATLSEGTHNGPASERASLITKRRHRRSVSNANLTASETGAFLSSNSIKKEEKNTVKIILSPVPICPLSRSSFPMEINAKNKNDVGVLLPAKSSPEESNILHSNYSGKAVDRNLKASNEGTLLVDINYSLRNSRQQYPICPLSNNTLFVGEPTKNSLQKSVMSQSLLFKASEKVADKKLNKRAQAHTAQSLASCKTYSLKKNVKVCLKDCLGYPIYPLSNVNQLTTKHMKDGNNISKEKLPKENSVSAPTGSSPVLFKDVVNISMIEQDKIPSIRTDDCSTVHKSMRHAIANSFTKSLHKVNRVTRASKKLNTDHAVNETHQKSQMTHCIKTEAQDPFTNKRLKTTKDRRNINDLATTVAIGQKSVSVKGETTNIEQDTENISCHLISPVMSKRELHQSLSIPKKFSLEKYDHKLYCSPPKTKDPERTSVNIAKKKSVIRKADATCNRETVPSYHCVPVTKPKRTAKKAKTILKKCDRRQAAATKKSKHSRIQPPNTEEQNASVVSINARPGTLKFREQIRSYLVNQNKDDNDDFLDTTPFRNKYKIKGLHNVMLRKEADGESDDDDIAIIETPKCFMPTIVPVSTRKTPDMPVIVTPTTFQPLKRKEIDRFLHHRNKARKRNCIGIAKVTVKQTQPKCFSKNVDVNIKELFTEVLNDSNEDECYYFFSDEDEESN